MKVTEVVGKDPSKANRTGAGAVLYARDTGKFLLVLRGPYMSRHPNTWSTLGGSIDPGEDARTAALREIHEESQYADPIELIELIQLPRYTTFLGIVPKQFTPIVDEYEAQDWGWFDWDQWPHPLHPGLEELLKNKDSIEKIRKVMNATQRKS